MSIETAPAFRVTTKRGHLIRERGHDAASVSEHALDAVLAKLSGALLPGAPFTKESIAEAVEAGVAVAHELAESSVCSGCGHLFAEHVGRHGCLGFDCPCTARRPYAAEAAAGGVQS